MTQTEPQATPAAPDAAQHERLRSYVLDVEERNSELQRLLKEAQDTKPQIAIQTGSGVIYHFPAGSSFGVLELEDDLVEPGSRSYLRDNGTGHSHCVALKHPDTPSRRVSAVLSGTEQECEYWLANIAHAVERAGIPTVLTQHFQSREQAVVAQDDAVRWGGS